MGEGWTDVDSESDSFGIFAGGLTLGTCVAILALYLGWWIYGD